MALLNENSKNSKKWKIFFKEEENESNNIISQDWFDFQASENGFLHITINLI